MVALPLFFFVCIVFFFFFCADLVGGKAQCLRVVVVEGGEHLYHLEYL